MAPALTCTALAAAVTEASCRIMLESLQAQTSATAQSHSICLQFLVLKDDEFPSVPALLRRLQACEPIGGLAVNWVRRV
jgi:hypothetical protein